MIPDAVAALVAFLKQDVELQGLLGTRVYGGELPASVTGSMPTEAVVVSPAGGLGVIGSAYQEYGDVRLDVNCYGSTPNKAHEIWRCVHPLLKQMQRTSVSGTLLHWAKPAGGPLSLRDPDTDWPYNFSSWQVLAAEAAAA